MSRPITVIDVDDLPELARLVEELRVGGQPIVLRSGGAAVALVVTPDSVTTGGSRRPLTEAEHEAFRRTAGGWEGIIDVDEFLNDVRESRRLPARPPVDLE